MDTEPLFSVTDLVALVFCTLLVFPLPAHADQVSSVEAELEKLVALAMTKNPRVQAARASLEQAVAKRDGVGTFFDTRVVALAGRSHWAAAVPGSTDSMLLEDNAVSGEFGIEKALRPGAYVNFGLGERYLLEPGDSFDSLYQSVVGAELRVPLARDRHFSKWRAEDRQAEELVRAATDALEAVAEDVRRDVEVAYVEYLRSLADIAVARMAVERAEKLLAEAEELTRLKVVPEYQLLSARLEVATNREEETAAVEASERARIALAEVLAEEGAFAPQADADGLTKWAEACGALEPASIEVACERRGFYSEILRRMQAAQAAAQLAREDTKPDVELSLSAHWQGEDPDSFIATDSLLAERRRGREVALVWSHPLGLRAGHAKTRAEEARIEQLQEELRAARFSISSEMAAAQAAFDSALNRLKLMATAVDEAAKTLAAENERFRLGEGTSRNVVEAQKDLTAVVRRRNEAARALLKARADWLHATGYGAADEETGSSRSTKGVSESDS